MASNPMLRTALAAVALLAAPAAMAQKADWRAMGAFGDGERSSEAFIDAASLKVAGTMRDVVVSTHFATPRTFSATGRRYTGIRISYRFDCATSQFQTTGSRAFDGETEILASETVTEMRPSSPGTIPGMAAAAVCSGDFSSFAKINGTPDQEGRRRYGQ